MKYNVDREKLMLPEYGRHIQKMINHCVSITDDEKRNHCANTITTVMGNLNPHLRDVPDFQHKLWDHLFIMSDFKLKINSPYPVPAKEEFQKLPRKLDYPKGIKKYRYYGRNIIKMIKVAVSWEEGDKKTALIYTIANHMKKSFLKWNKDTVNDQLIWEHLNDLSDGQLKIKGELDELTAANTERVQQNQWRTNHKLQKRRRADERF